MSEPLEGDDQRDAWLREALRHAPDAAVAAPPELRDAILMQARAAAAVPAWPTSQRKVAAATPLAALWSWLARPPVAAGFASVMAATLVGLMWWDRPMDEALPYPPAATVASDQAARQSPAPAAGLAAPAAVASPTTSPPSPAIVAEVTPAPAVAAPLERKAEQRAADRAASPGAGETALADSALKKQGEARKQESSGSVDKLAAALPKDLAAPAAERESQRGRDPERDAVLAQNSAPANPVGAAAPAPMPMPATMAAKAARPVAAAPASPSVDAMPTVTASPLAPWRSALAAGRAAGPQAFADGRGVPADDALSRWLADVDAAAAGRWERVEPPALRRDEAVASLPAGRSAVRAQPLRRPGGVVRIDGTTLRFESAGESPPQTWQAELPAPVAERLRTTMPRQPP